MKKKKKTPKAKIKRIKRKVTAMVKNAYYINKYYNKKIDDSTVLIESKNGDDIAANMFYILKELRTNKKYSKMNVFVVAKNNKVEKFKAFLENYKIENVQIVVRMSFKYLDVLSSAKYLFNDTSFPYVFVKKEGQVYTNTWHGTPLKYMSNDVPNRRYAMGNVKRNFMMADYLVYPNEEMEEKMLSAYSAQQLYTGKVLEAGYPRNAIFFNKERAKKVRKKLGIDDKQVIIYMPTWRGIMNKRKSKEQFKEIFDYMRRIDDRLKDNQIFYIKMHVLVERKLDFVYFKHIKPFPEGFETYDVLNAADCLVTDYSSVFFDYANSRKKIVLFTYDLEEYISTRGMYYDINDLPFPKANTPEKLVDEINKEKDYDDKEFLKKFCTFDNAEADKELVKFIIGNKKSKKIKEKETKKNGKDNVLVYSASLALNGITSSLVSLTNTIDIKAQNIFLVFREKTLKNNPLKLEQFSKDIEVFPMINGFKYSITEIIAYVLYYKLNIKTKWVDKKLDQLYTREIHRFFGFPKVDKVIQFSGYEMRIIGLFQRFKAPKAIFVHNDMCQEMETRGNQHKLTLKDAYHNYDRVVSVTSDIKDSILKISDREDNIIIVNNSHSYQNILEKKDQEIKFDDSTRANVSENVLKQILAKKDIIKFVNIGRYSAEKGHKRLIDAFNEFYKEHKNAYLFIIGGHGKLWNETNEYIKKLDCRYNVILICYMSNPFALLKECDLFILSSLYEGLGLVVLEAQTCGVPVISVDIKGPKGFMTEHGGYFVENSQEGILQGMKDFVDGKVKLMNFDPKKYNERVKKQYESIFDGVEGEK